MNTSYELMTPSVITDEKAQSYIEALNLCLFSPGYQKYCSNRAVRGGKSSVLLTWERAEDNDFRVMTVSLADFEMQRAYPGDSLSVEGKPDYDDNEKKAGKAERKQSSTASCYNCSIKEKKYVTLSPLWSAFLM